MLAWTLLLTWLGLTAFVAVAAARGTVSESGIRRSLLGTGQSPKVLAGRAARGCPLESLGSRVTAWPKNEASLHAYSCPDSLTVLAWGREPQAGSLPLTGVQPRRLGTASRPPISGFPPDTLEARATSKGSVRSRAAIVRLIRKTWAPYGRREQDRAMCIARRESGLRPWAESRGNVGLFQLNYGAHRRHGESYATFRARHVLVRVNVSHAYRVWLDARRRWGNGWLPWAVRGLCGA